jgi:uracil-DNA glycosylase
MVQNHPSPLNEEEGRESEEEGRERIKYITENLKDIL